MNKTTLIKAIATRANFTQKNTEKLLNSFMEIVIETLQKGEQIRLYGFASFKIKHKLARVGHNPKTGALIQIAATNIPIVKMSKKVKNKC